MAATRTIRRILLYMERRAPSGAVERYGRMLAEAFDASIEVLYMIENPLSAAWTAEVLSANLPPLHEGMEMEARERLAGTLTAADQERFHLQLTIGTAEPAEELARYVEEHGPDVIVAAAPAQDDDPDAAVDFVVTALANTGCAILLAR